MTTTAKEAANRLLECIVYHDLANRRGEAVADAIIDELSSIADAAPALAPQIVREAESAPQTDYERKVEQKNKDFPNGF